jgi:hypothetical protein
MLCRIFRKIRFLGSSLYGWLIIRMKVPLLGTLNLLARKEAHPRDSQASGMAMLRESDQDPDTPRLNSCRTAYYKFILKMNYLT